jgi:hypothetical protein
MSFRLSSGSTTTVLPSPEFSNVDSKPHQLNIKRATDGTRRVYKKTAQTQITKMKALELRAFLKLYFDSNIVVTDHNGDIWDNKLTNQPWSFVADQVSQSVTGREKVQIPLAF